jgi:hypothetical protein
MISLKIMVIVEGIFLNHGKKALGNHGKKTLGTGHIPMVGLKTTLMKYSRPSSS